MDAAAFALMLPPKMQERSRPPSPICPTKAFFPVYLNPPPSPRASTPRILPTPTEIPPEDLEDLGLASCTKRAIAKEVLTLVSERNRAKREKKSRYQEEEQRAFIASLESCRQAREEEGRNQRLASEEAWEDVDEARRYVERFLDDKWEEQRVNIQIDSEFNMDMVDLTAIGAMKRKEGVKACMKLLAAPVLHEKVALSLWRTLVGQVSEREVVEDTEEDEAEDETTPNFLNSASSSKRSLGSSSTNLRFRTEQRRMTVSDDSVSRAGIPPWPKRGLSGKAREKPRPFLPRRASADNVGVGLASSLKLTPFSSDAQGIEACATIRPPSRPGRASSSLNRTMSSFGTKIGHGYGGWVPVEELSQGLLKLSSGDVDSSTMTVEGGIVAIT